MGKSSNRQAAPSGGSGGGSGGTSTGKFTAPTSGLEDVIFASGMPKAVAIYEVNVERITNHLRVQAWKGGSELTKTIEIMKDPIYEEPEEPVRMYYTDETRANQETDDSNDDNTPRVPVVNDSLYAVLLQKYQGPRALRDQGHPLHGEQRKSLPPVPTALPEAPED